MYTKGLGGLRPKTLVGASSRAPALQIAAAAILQGLVSWELVHNFVEM